MSEPVILFRKSYPGLMNVYYETDSGGLPQFKALPAAEFATLTRDLASARTARDEMAAKVLSQVDAAITKATGLDNVARLQRERDEARTALAEAKALGDERLMTWRSIYVALVEAIAAEAKARPTLRLGWVEARLIDNQKIIVDDANKALARIDAVVGEGGA